MDPSGGGGSIGDPSRCSSPPKSNCPVITRHKSNPAIISLIPSSSSSSSSTPPHLPGREDKNRTVEARVLDSSLSSATFISHNEDLLIQILLFLPPKSLLRFQTVSKQWLSMISDPTFRRRHCRKYPSSRLSFFLCRGILGPPEFHSISFHEEDGKSMSTFSSRLISLPVKGTFMGLHSCNGLVVCIQLNSNYHRTEIVVYNPTTNQHRIIPQQISAAEKYEIRTVNIAFDPLLSDHYKLVCLWCDRDEIEFCFTVYSSEIGVWSKISGTHEIVGDLYHFHNGVFWNGNLHWFSQAFGTLCFDVDDECLRPVIPNPPDHVYGRDINYFGESAGHLFIIGLKKPQPVLLEVFSLKRDYSEWVVKYCIYVGPLSTLYSSMLLDEKQFALDMLRFVVDDKEKKVMAVISVKGKLIYYEINSMTVEDAAGVDVDYLRERSYSLEDVAGYSWLDAFQHTETLACV